MRAVRQTLAWQRSPQGDGLHAQTLAGLHRLPSNLPIDAYSYRHVEVLTGAPRRRHWSPAEKGVDCRGEFRSWGGDEHDRPAAWAAPQSALRLAPGIAIGDGRLRWHFAVCSGGGGEPGLADHVDRRNRDQWRDGADWAWCRPEVSRRDRPGLEGVSMIVPPARSAGVDRHALGRLPSRCGWAGGDGANDPAVGRRHRLIRG
jgi:hypothetical protein